MCRPSIRLAVYAWLLLCFRARQYHQQYSDEDEFDILDISEEVELPQPFVEMSCFEHTEGIRTMQPHDYDYNDDRHIIMQCDSATAINLHHNYDKMFPNSNELRWLRKLEFVNSDIDKITNGLFDTSRIDNINQHATILSFTNVNLRRIETNSLSRLTNLRELELNRNKLESLQSGSLNGLESLERLDASDNMLSGFIDKRNFTGVGLQLSYLNLSWNNITFIRKNCFSDFTNLASINISHNSLTLLASSLFEYNLRLVDINLAFNSINQIGNSTFHSYHIARLDLSFNKLSEINSVSFATNDLSQPIIHTLKLNDNSLISYPQILNDIKVYDFTINNNNIQEIKWGYFCNSLNVNYMDLTVLTNISMCNTGSTIMASHNNLQEIPLWRDMLSVLIVELQYNNISNIPLGAFSQLIHLDTLRLDKNYLTDLQIGAFSGLNNLVNLNISFNKLSSIDHHVLYGLKQLKELYLGGNRLTTLPYDDIFISLKSLEKLGLSHNHWNCFNLMKILRTMDERNIKIAHHGHIDYHVTNLGGVRCWNDKNYVNTTDDYSRTTEDPVTYTSRLITKLTSLSTEAIWTKQTNKATTTTTELSTTASTMQTKETTKPNKGVRTTNTAELLDITNTSTEKTTTMLPTILATFVPKEHMEERIIQEKLQHTLNPVNELIKANDEKYNEKLQAMHSSMYEIKNIFIIIILLLSCVICIQFYKFYKRHIKKHSLVVAPSTTSSRQNFANEIEM